MIDGPAPTGLARGKRTVTVIAYRLFHSPAKDLRYSAAANHINRQRYLHSSRPTLLISAYSNVKSTDIHNIYLDTVTLEGGGGVCRVCRDGDGV